MSPSSAAAAATSQPVEKPRVLTPALSLFLVAVVGALAWGATTRLAPSGALAIATELRDGDGDGPERTALLRKLVAEARATGDRETRWLGLMAAVALDDSAAHAAILADLGGPAPGQTPTLTADHLSLGDDLVRNVAVAMLAEAAPDRDAARTSWRQVAEQCRLVSRPLAAALAAAGEQRLR